VPSIVILPRAEAQIVDVLGHTLDAFGEAKYVEYRDLIEHALGTLAATPTAGKRRSDIHPDAWTFHIARPARRARHLFLYRVRGSVEVARFSTTRWTSLASDRENGSERWPTSDGHRDREVPTFSDLGRVKRSPRGCTMMVQAKPDRARLRTLGRLTQLCRGL
jgi:plasmid stabilization system protein ParE